MTIVHLSGEERRQIREVLREYQQQAEVQSMRKFIQHGRTTTYEHCMNVVRFSYWLNRKFHLKANERALLIGALLHDFYLYDWHEKSTWHRLHGFSHPFRASRNAKKLFRIGPVEENIIESHMWPLTLRHYPKCREAAIVCVADKCCSVLETVSA
ncbi:MAG: HD domain-containing protein [Eubacteriales bacterium]|nr:HD domain-containing protein [Eubacteriales bacterium]